MLKETKKFIGKSLQPARPVHHLSSKQAIALNFQTELPSNTEVCLQNKVGWLSEMTEVKILTQTVMPCQPKQHESEAKKGSAVTTITCGQRQEKITIVVDFVASLVNAYSLRSKNCSPSSDCNSLTGGPLLLKEQTSLSPGTTERIKYSRDFLLKLSSVSLSQKKPEFLPDHPIVLEKPEKSNPSVDISKK